MIRFPRWTATTVFTSFFLIFLFLLTSVFLCDRLVEQVARGRVFSSVNDCPKAPVALVLGCSPRVSDGRPNLYFTARMDTAAALYLAGKCRILLVSGDNGRIGYDEPTAMQDALIARGIPKEAIALDFAGFDTLDSVVRAKAIFGVKDLIVVSQSFHNERAICIARHHGIEAKGCNAPDVGGGAGLRTRLREKLARVKTVLDLHLLNSRPKYLGAPVELAFG